MEFSSKLGEGGLELVSVICYRLWLRRNDLIFRNLFCGPKHFIKAACTDIIDFSMAIVEPREGRDTGLSPVEEREGRDTDCLWKPPSGARLKVNFDASFLKPVQKVGLGIVIRDSKGDPMVMVAGQRDSVNSAYLAEGDALSRAFSLCADLGVDEADFEGDAKMVIDAILDPTPDSSWSGQLVEDLKKGLSSKTNWKLTHVRRDGNRVTHVLAKLALPLDCEFVWMEDGLYVAMPYIASDKPDCMPTAFTDCV
ncbi:uncharacterized protein LOC122304943 [Carya illinoinensis]|uniref:uncharacterized protein LOC122304943 n=1 Tax=Carya illinoinensis TaxID=32201 RepID=UPI001C7297DA|nr:uncharacterized protein LOC122304943 [Carya illinoinensis]